MQELATQQHIKNARSVIKKTLKNQYLQKWLETQNRSSTSSREKFTQKEVKNNYQFENYLTLITKQAHRISLTRLRCHALRIQTGKYENRGALIPVEERTCLVCKENCSLTHSLARSLARSLTHARTHARTHSLTHSLTHSITQSLTQSPTHPLTHSLITVFNYCFSGL